MKGGLDNPSPNVDVILTTRGDVLRRGVAASERLAAGAAGEVLTMGANDPAWAAPGGVADPHGAAQHTDVTRELFIPAACFPSEGVSSGALGIYATMDLSDSVLDRGYFTTKVPDDFVSFSSVKLVWTCLGGGVNNMYWKLIAWYAAQGEAYNLHTDTPAYGVTASGGNSLLNVQEPPNPLTLVNLAIGDYLGFCLYRDAAHANDTLGQTTYNLGLLFTYVANQ